MIPLDVYDWLDPSVLSCSDGNRVSSPIFEASHWSMEIEFRKPASPGCRAAVNHVIDEE